MPSFLTIFLVLFSLSSCSTFNSLMGIKETKVDFPPGEYIGTAKLVKQGEEIPTDLIVEKIKINFIPKDPGITDGIGVLTMSDESHRFHWRSDGNNIDTWNILFTKDSNLYSNINNSFKFDGVMTKKEIANRLEGRLYFDNDSLIKQYFIEVSQIFKPKIIPPKEAISIKAGDSFDISVEKAGEAQEDIEVLLYKPANEKEEEVSKVLMIKQMLTEKGVTTISLATDKALLKGDYTLKLTRSGEYTSNTIPVNLK